MEYLKKPFTEEQCKKINEFQKSGKFHPLTCDRKHKNCEVNNMNEDRQDGVLIATEDGLICPCGKYKQNSINSFILER
jgi:hypothetical protein